MKKFFDKMTVLLSEDDMPKDMKSDRYFDIVRVKGDKTLISPNKSSRVNGVPKDYDPDMKKSFDISTKDLSNTNIVFTNSSDIGVIESVISKEIVFEIINEKDILEALELLENWGESGILRNWLNKQIEGRPLDVPVELAVSKLKARCDENCTTVWKGKQWMFKEATMTTLNNIERWFKEKNPRISQWASSVINGLVSN